jgi:subtilisin family serine protease
MSNSNRVLLKLRPTASLAAADPRARLRPLHDAGSAAAAFGLASEPAWFIADLPDGGPTPWDSAHTQVAAQLGIDESAVVFAEPDLPQSFPDTNERNPGGQPFAVDTDCTPKQQTEDGKRVKGPGTAWHLGENFSQLDSARNAVQFSDPRTRIAIIDTGYDKSHTARPERILESLERNFVDGNNQPSSAQDANRHRLFDNSGHGTGTSGILAGRKIPAFNNIYLGGAPHADIVPLRIADSVLLFFTSAFAQAIDYAVSSGCDVVSISMGGLPSRAWNEAVNKAYEAGVCIVAAAGNSFGGVPTHNVVYPARYHRTIAACGVMANNTPYYDLDRNVLEGNWGPDSSMTSAMASYTPNIPWAKFGCGTTIDLDGEGTSSATPQIAAAVALWYEKNKNVLPRDWRRVEAVRFALFKTARDVDRKHLGRGILQAKAALGVSPVLNLTKTPADSDSFSFLRVITGLGVTDAPAREKMFNLEITQRWLMSEVLREIVTDPDAVVPPDKLGEFMKDKGRRFMEALIADEKASLALRKHVAERYPLVFGSHVKNAPFEVVRPIREQAIQPPDPPFRRIRTYAVDPSFSTRLETASINEATLKVRWEKLEPGPKGEYIEVVDTDADGKTTYAPVDLNDPRLLAQDGYAPAEGNPAFHQQMVYAVASKTIAHFERALGRPVLWRPEPNPKDEHDDSKFVRRLRVRPHALRQANAFYSPQQVALLFGYFEASASDPGNNVPGSRVYACLSHDIIAHETTHAILDGMHRRFNEPSNPDVLALHEAFADIVALMQHFTIPEILENEISRTRGDLESESILGSLAVQFGRAVGGRGALRDAIGKVDERGVWTRLRADPSDYQKQLAPHARGAILVAAVFDAFLAIYKRRTEDLLRIYTGGTGVLPSGAIHPDLVRRLADEASKSAQHVLNMCIRALDYIPPVDITFGEYLRGLITADSDLVEDDRYNYRIAFVEAFRRRGIYPHDVETLSVDTLRWQGIDITSPPPQHRLIVEQLKRYADACLYIADRKELFEKTRGQREELHKTLKKVFAETPDFASTLGLDPELTFEIHELRSSMRVGPDGQHIPQIIAAITQRRSIRADASSESQIFRGGSTLVVSLSEPAVKYAIIKNINSDGRRKRTEDFLRDALQDPLRALLFAPDGGEPFAALHSFADVGGL